MFKRMLFGFMACIALSMPEVLELGFTFFPHAVAAQSINVKQTQGIMGYGRYVGANAVKKFTDTPTDGVALPGPDSFGNYPTYAMVVVEGGTVRWLDKASGADTAPSSTIGTPLVGELDYDGDLRNIQFFIPTGATLHVSYYY